MERAPKTPAGGSLCEGRRATSVCQRQGPGERPAAALDPAMRWRQELGIGKARVRALPQPQAGGRLECALGVGGIRRLCFHPLSTGSAANCGVELCKIHLASSIIEQGRLVGLPTFSHMLNNPRQVRIKEL